MGKVLVAVREGISNERSYGRRKQNQMLNDDGISKLCRTGLLVLLFTSFFPALFHLHEYIFFGLLVVSVVTVWQRREFMSVATSIDKPLLFFIGWILLTVPFASDPLYSFGEWRKLAVQGLVFYWSIFALRLFGDPHMIRHVSLVVGAGVTVIASNAVIQFFLTDGALLFDRALGTRALAMGSDANVLSTYMVLGMPSIVMVGMMPRMKTWRACWGAVSIVALAANYLSYMRAGWLAMAIEAVFFGGINKETRLTWAAAGGSIGFFIAMAILYQFGYYTGIFSFESIHSRFQYWETGVGRLLASPLVGIGYGQLTENLSLHNLFLMVAVGSGFPGVFLLLYLFISSVKALALKAHTSTDESQRVYAIAGAVMVVGFAVRNFFDYMFAGGLASLFWILLAVGFASCAEGDGGGRKYRW